MVCYADDLQRLLYNLHLSCLTFNMKISVHETKAMTISKDPVRSKLEIDGWMVEQVMKFYLDVNVIRSRNVSSKNEIPYYKQRTYKLQIGIDGYMVEQVMEFNYLDVNVTSSVNLVKESKTRDQKQQK